MYSRRTRIFCVNCNICVNTLRRYRILDQNTRVCTVLCNWIYPQIITDDDYVCEACWELSMATANQNLQQNIGNEPQAGTSQRGHTNICILCGCSLVRRQSDKILKDNPTEMQLQMIEIIKRRKEPQQVTTADKVCHVCWLRTKREVLRMNCVDDLRQEGAMQHGDDNASHSNPANAPTEEAISLGDYQSCGDPYEQDILRPSGSQNIESRTMVLQITGERLILVTIASSLTAIMLVLCTVSRTN